MSKNRCACGNEKYPDSDCCEECWKESKKYDIDRSDPYVCPNCGDGKYPDASLCESCWKKQKRWYGD